MRAHADTASEAGLLASAIALRWSRPDLTAALAEHVGETSVGDDRTWVTAVGWLVHGRAAIGDGRGCASDALVELARRGVDLLDEPVADRLRIEVATLAAGQCESAAARLLVEPVLAADRPADVRADAYGVLARCVLEERPAAIGQATRRAEAAWGEIGGVDAEIASASLGLLSAAALRRSGHPDSAVDRAAEGLARLDRVRAGQIETPSRHLAAALAAEWITALIEAGRMDDAREGCLPMVQQLRESARPTRQVALLRLTVARAVAESTSSAAFEALEQAAKDAADCDTPDLEGLCHSTLGTLRGQAGRLDAALESMRRGVAAQRRDRARSERFRAALRAMSLGSPRVRAEAAVVPLDRQARAAATISRTHSPIAATIAEDLIEPAHPLAGGGAADPWSTGRWSEQRAVAVTETGGRRRRSSRATAEPADPALPTLGSAGHAEDDDVVHAASGPSWNAASVVEAAGRHAVPVGMDTAAQAVDAAASGDAGRRAPVGFGESADLPSDIPADPLFGPLEHLTRPAPDDSGVHDDSATADVLPAVEAATTAASDTEDRFGGRAKGNGRIDDVPVAPEGRAESAGDDGERWLEAALAELDRVWGRPLPDLDGTAGLRSEPTAAAGDAAVDAAVDEVDRPGPSGGSPEGMRSGQDLADAQQAGDENAATGVDAADIGGVDLGGTDPADADPADADPAADGTPGHHEVGDGAATSRRSDGSPALPLRSGDVPLTGSPTLGRPVSGPDAVGCVVVIDVVRAGTQVADGGELLREVADRLTGGIPPGARLRSEPDDSALSVVLPGRDWSAATDWMHQTLPAVFADMGDLGLPARWAAGTTLRSAVHDTDGPVGAQLLRRLDLVTPQSPARRARHDVAQPAAVRWGVPILAGSGGRRRRADGESRVDRPGVDRPHTDQTGGDHPAAARPGGDLGGGDALEVGPGRRGVERPDRDPDRTKRPADEHPRGGARGLAGRHRVVPGRPEAARTRLGPAADAAAGLLVGPPEPGSSVQGPSDVDEVRATEEPAFSVEGLGLADLLAGALAAYRAI